MLEREMDLPHGQDPTDNIWEAIYTQRAIRYWQDRRVPRELLEQVIEAGSKAPSGSNLQPWIFLVVDDDEKRIAISTSLREVFEGSPAKALVDAGEDSENRSQRLMLRGAREFLVKI